MSGRSDGRMIGRSDGQMSSYLSIAGCFLLAIVALKIVEFLLAGFDVPNRFQLLVNGLVYNCVVVAWAIVGVGIVHFLLSMLSPKVSDGVAVTLLGLLLVSETGLTIYSLHNGYVLGSELFLRPLSESLTAIRGAMGIVMPILLTIALLAGFIALALWRARKKKKKAGEITLIVFVSAMLLLSLFFKTSHLFTFGVSNCYVHNKLYYLIDDGIKYRKYWSDSPERLDDSAEQMEKLRLSDEELELLLATHPEWGTPLDREYPLERTYVADTFINHCFSKIEDCTEKPNIVVLLVESMGHEFMGWGAMPFVDSLAATGLYWPNCLSATIRSYGAIPAITGSLGGPKSFQFGAMPDHNSLFTLLKGEGYNTRAYYGGEFTFDCIYEYLSAQGIDYLSPFYENYKKIPGEKDDYWWGAGDDYLFTNTIANMNEEVSSDDPHISLITTLSMHDILKLSDKKRQRSYEERAKKVCKRNPHVASQVASHVSATLFTDDCIKEFIHKYSRRPDFGRTIFVLVGDHASGLQQGDKLSFHHVPLIIWSPLVKKAARFSHIVTHNDIAPALYSLLTSHYGIKAQPTVHWLGDGLGATPKTLLIVNYMHEITDIIYHNRYYEMGDRYTPESVYTFDTSMQLHREDNKGMVEETRRQLELMKALYFYTYFTNHLTARPLAKRHYEVVRQLQSQNEFVCTYPDQPPSKARFNTIEILPTTNIALTKDYTHVRVEIEADVSINKDINMLQYPEIVFTFMGKQEIREGDKMSKFFTDNNTSATGTYHLSLSKEYPLDSSSPSSINVEVKTPYKEEEYVAGVVVTLTNVRWSIAYAK